MQQPFIQSHGVAGALLVATLVGSALLEWTVTAHERVHTTSGPGAGLPTRVRVGLATLIETTTLRTGGSAADRGTKRVLAGSMLGAVVLGWWIARAVSGARMPGSGWIWFGIGLPVIWLGVALRVWSIAVLGRFFRRVVVVQEGQRVISNGPYRVIRHPAYAGNLLAAAGLGFVLGNWLSLAILVVVPVLGHIPRIRVEEAELGRNLGESYRRYAATRRRVVPGVW